MRGSDDRVSIRTSVVPWPDEPDLSGSPDPALDRDLYRAVAPLGLASLRAAVLEVDTQDRLGAWSLHGPADAEKAVLARPLEQALPGALEALVRLVAHPSGQTTVQRLSPRRWLLAWSLSPDRVVVAQATYRDGRPALQPPDLATLRALCDAGMQADVARQRLSDLQPRREPRASTWPQVERRRHWHPDWVVWPSLVLVCVSALLAAWLAVVSVPQLRADLQAQATRQATWQRMAEGHFTRSVAAALANGDYDEVQAVLAGFMTQGYLEQAVVTNTRQQVVAVVGQMADVRPGEPLPAQWAAPAQQVELRLGAEPFGRLFYRSRHGAVDATAAPLRHLQWLAGLALASAALGAGLIAARRPRH